MSRSKKNVRFTEVIDMVECIIGRKLHGAPTDELLSEALEILGFDKDDIDYSK